MGQQGPVGCGQTAVGCGHFEKRNFNAMVVGDMMFQSLQLINPFVENASLQSSLCSRLESVDNIYHNHGKGLGGFSPPPKRVMVSAPR